MRIAKSKLGFLVTALLGISQAAQTQVPVAPDKFIPLEKLSPEIRALYGKRIFELEQNANINWDTIVVGIDEKGALILKDRHSSNIEIVSSPSCWPTQ